MDQIFITLFGITAVFLSQSEKFKYRKYASVFGLLSQPFWIYFAYTTAGYGVLLVTILYTFSWLKGFYTYWIKEPVETDLEKQIAILKVENSELRLMRQIQENRFIESTDQLRRQNQQLKDDLEKVQKESDFNFSLYQDLGEESCNQEDELMNYICLTLNRLSELQNKIQSGQKALFQRELDIILKSAKPDLLVQYIDSKIKEAKIQYSTT